MPNNTGFFVIPYLRILAMNIPTQLRAYLNAFLETV